MLHYAQHNAYLSDKIKHVFLLLSIKVVSVIIWCVILLFEAYCNCPGGVFQKVGLLKTMF